ncbi:MAG: hypothetical protein QG639_984 [Patescibacteria group bacterium]|nr:hypothetical protein [Patescibacteria group bacterium]
MNKKVLLVSLVLYLFAAVASFTAFSAINKHQLTESLNDGVSEDDETLLGSLLDIDPGAPKDQPCPLNGKMYTAAEKSAWEKRRPLAVMIENSPDARPQSGLSDADVVYEIVAEGGVTRFMGMFYCGVQAFDTTLAPIRSARTYFVEYASGYNYPLYVHVGGANLPGPTDALGQIGQYGWNQENDLNQFSIGYPTFIRNANRLGKQVATEHTMETTTEKLWAVGEERGWTNMSPETKVGIKVVPAADWKAGFEPWTFYDTNPAVGAVTKISHDFWSGYGQYAVTWDYDAASNMYKRTMGGEVHTDLNDDSQIMASNVVVILTEEKGPLNENKHMLYTTIGTGEALIFNNGQAIKARWSKPSREAELRFVDAKGTDVSLARGPVWIAVVDKSTEVEY